MKRIKRLFSGTSAAVLTLSSLMTLGFNGVAHAAAQTCTWTGGGSDNKFSTAANWTNCGGGAPGAGDNLLFNSSVLQSKYQLNNDLSVAFGNVTTMPVSTPDSTHTSLIQINALNLADGSTIKITSPSDCNSYALKLAVPTVTSAGSITLNHIYAQDINSLQVTGDVTYVGYGGSYFPAASSVGGSVHVVSETQNPTNYCGGSGQGYTPVHYTVHSLNVQNNANFQADSNVTYPVTLGGGSGTPLPRMTFLANVDTNNGSYVPTTYTISGPITLTGNAEIYVGDMVTVNITGTLNGSGFTLSRVRTSSGVLNNNATTNNTSTTTGTITNPPITTPASDAQPNASYTVGSNETYVLDGSRGSVTVGRDGTLEGTGTASYVYAANGSIVAPGHSPGKLTVVNSLILAGGSTYQAQLKNSTDGNYDQISASSVTLGDSTSSPTLAVSLYDGYSIKAGDTFKIIDNTSTNPVSGTFASMPEGATFNASNGSVFKISYVGGDGNDVVLTAMTAPTAPDTGFALLAANPVATLGFTAIAAGIIAMIARSKSRKLAPARVKASRRK